MTTSAGGLPQPTDPGSRCVCGHPQHPARCPCGCSTYIAAGSHPEQSRGGAVPAVIAFGAFAMLVVVVVLVIVVWALG